MLRDMVGAFVGIVVKIPTWQPYPVYLQASGLDQFAAADDVPVVAYALVAGYID